MKGYGEGNFAKAALGGAMGAAVGAMIWVMLAFFTGWQFGIFAIVLGGFVGFGVGQGWGGRGGLAAGVLAGSIALVGVLAAHYGVLQVAIDQFFSGEYEVDDELMLDHIAWGVLEEFEAAEVEMTYVDDDSYPPEVWAEAERRWASMDEFERAEAREAFIAQAETDAENAGFFFDLFAYLFTFGFFDLLCLGLAVSTAFKIASRNALEAAVSRGMVTEDGLSLTGNGSQQMRKSGGTESSGFTLLAAAPATPLRAAEGAAAEKATGGLSMRERALRAAAAGSPPLPEDGRETEQRRVA